MQSISSDLKEKCFDIFPLTLAAMLALTLSELFSINVISHQEIKLTTILGSKLMEYVFSTLDVRGQLYSDISVP